MSDKLKWIRHEANCWGTDTHESKALHEAADRIEELEAQLAAVHDSIPWEWLEMANEKYGKEIFPNPYD